MADNDKKAETSKPAGGPAGQQAGSGASQPLGAVKPDLGPKDVKPSDTKPADTKPSDSKPTGPASSDSKPSVAGFTPQNKPSSEPARPRGGPGSEWRASDDRGPLGRAEDEIGADTPVASATSAPTSGKDNTKTGATAPDAKASSGATSTPVKPTSISAKSAAAGKTDTAKDPGSAKIATVPPVDAAKNSAPDTTKTARPAASVAASQTSPTPSRRDAKRSLWPVAAALVLGAIIGAGSAAFVYRGYADDTQPDPKVVDLTNRVAALEKRPDPQAAIGSLKSSMSTLDSQVAALRQTPRQAQGGAPSPAAPQPSAPPQTTADLGEINQKVAALQAKVDQLKAGADTKALEQKVGALQSELDQAKSTATAAQTSVTAVQGQQKEIASRVMMPALAVVADSLVQQIDHGLSYATQVDALAALGADPAKVAILRQNAAKGVPSAPVLAAKFEPLAQPIAATANKSPPNAGLGERLKSNMLSIVSIRRADDTSGDDLPSRVARIKAALAHDDVAGALDALSRLPPDAKAKAEAWGALAKTHVDAMNAARALQQDAITALGSKKS